MESRRRRRRNSGLGNEEEDEFVDYDEEQEAEQTTASGESNTQTSLTEQAAEIPEIPATRPGDGFNIDENEETSQHESLSASYHSEYSSQKSEYDGKGFLKSYTPLATPRLDFGSARLRIDKKLVAFIKDDMVHNMKPEVDFSSKGFSTLSTVYKVLAKEEQTTFFLVLEQLKDSLTSALSACLHYSLVVKVIEQKRFWPDIATEIGITPPTKKPSMMFGKSNLYYVGHANIRNRQKSTYT